MHEHDDDQQQPGAAAAEWDARYSEHEAAKWSGRPNGRLVAEVADLTPGRALDVGCGEGADAIWLSRRGWAVTAIDISDVAIGRARGDVCADTQGLSHPPGIIWVMGYTVIQIADRLRTEADAWAFMEELRWPNGPVCSHCDNIGATFIQPRNGISRKTRTGAETQRRVWRCLDCRKQFSVTTGTVFHGTRAPLRTWMLVIFDMCANKNGTSAREIERKYAVCGRTAWFMLHRIREAMKGDAIIQTMRGTIVADETWIGGTPSNRHASVRNSPVSLKAGENARTDKTPVLSLINATTGEVRSAIVPNVTGAVLRKVIASQVDMAGSTLYTDSGAWYGQLGQEFASHQAVDHSAGEYVRGDVTTNTAEGFFSQLKRSIDGTHHHVSVEHLPRYLAEFDFRYTTRKMSDTARMGTLMGHTGHRRLTYKRITG